MILKIVKFSSMIFIALLLSIHLVRSFALTEPLPVGIKTLRGESQDFYFQIQNMGNNNELTCTYSITGMDPIIVSLNEDKVTIDANGVKNIYGTVSVPGNAEIKTYIGQLTASCSSLAEVSGTGSVIQPSMNVRFIVDVVATKPEGPTPYIPPEESIPTYNLGMIMLITIIIVLVVGIYFWSEKKKK